MDYPGDFPPTPEERAGMGLAANAAWLARRKELGYEKYPPSEKQDEDTVAHDNATALSDAKKAIESEREQHKCFICGRRDLPRYARWCWLAVLASFLLFLYAGEVPVVRLLPEARMWFGIGAAVALGGALTAGAYKEIKPDDEGELRRKFHWGQHS